MYIPDRVKEIINLYRFSEKLDYAVPCKNNEQRVVGDKYFCSYWGKAYDVLSVDGYKVTIKWEDGKIATHYTPLSSSDWHFIKGKPYIPH